MHCSPFTVKRSPMGIRWFFLCPSALTLVPDEAFASIEKYLMALSTGGPFAGFEDVTTALLEVIMTTSGGGSTISSPLTKAGPALLSASIDFPSPAPLPVRSCRCRRDSSISEGIFDLSA